MTKKPNVRFPKRFLWGASTSAHQVEGNNHNQWTVWELEHAKTNAAAAQYHFHDLPVWEMIRHQALQPENYVSGQASDHYERYEADFDLLSQMNLNSYRFSIEWSRVEPEEGTWNSEAIAHYVEYVKALRARQIEPVVTLFHFTLPVWFSERGGFERRANVKYFVRFAEKILSELGGLVKYVITVNEPTIYATKSYYSQEWPPMVHSKIKTWQVLRNLALAHNRVFKLSRTLNRRYKVSVAHNTAYYYPGDNAWLSRVSAQWMQFFGDDYFLRKVTKQCDFLGVNFYFSNRVYGYRVHNPDERVSDLGWDLSPANLQYALERLYRKYNLPLIVTEAGLADADDAQRKWLIAEHIMAMQRAQDEGVDVRGYLHWSLLDNYEWGYGRWARFGLTAVDYDTQRRQLRPSAVWYGKVVKKLRSDT